MSKNNLLKIIFLIALISMLLLVSACGKKAVLPTDTTSTPSGAAPAASGDSVSQISGAVTDASTTDQELNTDDADKAVSGVGDALSDW